MKNTRPLPGIDDPRTFQDMDDWFQREAGCRAYIRRLRWPDGFVCRYCGFVGEPWVTAQGVLICKACNTEISLTAGTVFQDTRKPLRTWFLARWFITSQKNGVSALGLAAGAGTGKLRNGLDMAAQTAQRDGATGSGFLSGEIEVEETYVGGPEEGKRGREIENTSLVRVPAEKNGRGIRRVRLQHVKTVSAESLLDCIRKTVEPGTTIHPDGWKSYAGSQLWAISIT